MMKIILERKSYLTSGCHPNLRYLSLGFVPAARKRLKANLHPAGKCGSSASKISAIVSIIVDA